MGGDDGLDVGESVDDGKFVGGDEDNTEGTILIVGTNDDSLVGCDEGEVVGSDDGVTEGETDEVGENDNDGDDDGIEGKVVSSMHPVTTNA